MIDQYIKKFEDGEFTIEDVKDCYQSGIAVGIEEGYKEFYNNSPTLTNKIRSQIIHDAIEVLEQHYSSAKNPEFKAGIAHAQNILKEKLLT